MACAARLLLVHFVAVMTRFPVSSPPTGAASPADHAAERLAIVAYFCYRVTNFADHEGFDG
jgi:hypothetical protein